MLLSRLRVLGLNAVTKRFDKFLAVDNLTLEIPDGTIFGLLGPNGAGKTTLLRMIMGLVEPTSGSIEVFGSTNLSSSAVKSKIGYMPQNLALYPGLTVQENIEFFGRLYGVPETRLAERTKMLMDLVELSGRANARVDTLSGGMVRRTMLASVLVHEPKLLILDEPTAGVDPALRVRFWEWFESLRGAGTSIIITTHHIAEASRCQAVVFLRQGAILDKGTPNAIMQRYGATDLEQAFVTATEKEVPQ